MRIVSTVGNKIAYTSDEPEIKAISGKVVSMMKERGFDVKKQCAGSVTVFSHYLTCKKWENADRRLLREEAISSLNECISKCLLEKR